MAASLASGLEDEQALQVLAFGKLERHRVVARRRRSARRSSPRTPASSAAPATIFWKSAASTPPEQENVASRPPGREQLEREQVDVLVGARRAFARARRSARTSADRARRGRTARARSRSVRRCAKTSACDELDLRRHRAGWRRGSRARSSSASAELSIGDDARRAAGERGDGEAAGVAEAVEHVAPARRARARAGGCRAGRGRSRSSGPARRRRWKLRPYSMIGQRDAARLPRTKPDARLEAFELARLGVGALVDRRRSR